MSIYQEKLIELLSVEQKFDRSYLHIKLLFNQEIELHWEIDNKTANLLKSKINFDENVKYNLSLNSSWYEEKGEFTSFVTKTSNHKSEKIYFSCSEEYHLQLHSIKNMKDLRILIDLPYLSITRSSSKNEKNNSKRYKLYGWITVATISLLSIILIGYKSHTCVSKSFFCGKKPAKAESVAKAQNIKVNEKQNKIEQQKQDPKKTSIKNVSQPNSQINEPDVRYAKQEPVKKPVLSLYPTTELKNVVSYSIPEGSVALTFDDGPSKYSKEFVNILKKYKVGGTFFYIGENVQRFPENVLYAYSNGYSVGSHSMHHYDFVKLSYKQQENDLIQTNNLIKNITKQDTVLFRPPYGAKNEATIQLMQKHQFKMVLWNKDTEDWKNRNTNTIIHYVKSYTESGSIILLHESKPSLDALPQIIEYLKSKNLKIVSLN
ncbi:polysaccharide deacetylase family protein [Arthrobacter citreus]|nr:polysaccharide deacetylase family protein [Arthrobacter citreus]